MEHRKLWGLRFSEDPDWDNFVEQVSTRLRIPDCTRLEQALVPVVDEQGQRMAFKATKEEPQQHLFCLLL